MKTLHTPTPWCFAEESLNNDGMPETVICGLNGRAAIAVTLDLDENNPGMREANARRIVACVNAFDGIEDPELWVAQMRYMDSDHTISLRIIDRLEQQRDELRAAAITARIALAHAATESRNHKKAYEKAYEELDAAIAKATDKNTKAEAAQ